jgi:regulator of sirC expression with transglutaminase-like and TPR domain
MELRPPTPEFRELAERLRADDESVGLAEAALRLAAEFQPGVALEPARTELARLGAEAARSVPANGSLAARAASLLEYLHGGCGFRGNELHYDDPRNSFLPEVLARRTGIPITLSIVAIEVAARAGLALCGVSFPGHFLARSVAEPPVVLDAFDGRVLDADGCTALLRRALGPGAALEPGHLEPAGTRDVLVRMLANLKHGYASRQDWVRAVDCCDRILLLVPEAAGELRDRGLLYEQLECFGPALDDLERFLALAPRAPEADALRARVEALRPQAARIH